MAKFCSNCGNPCQEGAALCSSCGARIENNAVPQQAAHVQQPMNAIRQPGAELGMKWFKFIIYFQIFASAILNVISAFSSYNHMKEFDHFRGHYAAFDAYLDGSQTWTLIVLVAYIALAVFGFVVRGKLAGFKVDGPKNYLLWLALLTAVSVVYLIATYMLSNEFQDAMGYLLGEQVSKEVDATFASSIPSLVISVVMIFVNKAYFDKRIHLFLNY